MDKEYNGENRVMGGAGLTPGRANTARDSETVRAILRLGKMLDGLRGAVNDLEKKLSPALRAVSPTEASDKIEKEGFTTQLASAVDSKAEMAREILEHVEGLIIRLEV